MSIVELLLLLILIGVGLYFVNRYIPMAAPIRTLVNIVVVLLVVLWLLEKFGLLHTGHIPSFRRH
jgi:hypothetical protein